MGNAGQELARKVVEISYKDLTPALVLKMKQIILDSIGCALASRVTDRGRIALEVVNELGGNTQATIIGGGRSSWALATYANAEMIHALDYEVCGPGRGHTLPYVLSPSLAIAERMKSSGKDLITGVALALEIGGRMFSAVALNRDAPVTKPFSVGSCAVYGGVAGASSLMRLDSKRIAHAFGIAGTNTIVLSSRDRHTPGGNQGIMTKFNTLTGWIAQLATMSCLLAEKGFTGDTTYFDGELGFKNVMGSDTFKPEAIVANLGKIWLAEKIGEDGHYGLKTYPSCAALHAGISLINQIIRENKIDPANIEEIVVKSTPAFQSWEVVSFADCSHNPGYIYAVAAFHGQNPGPHWQMPGTYNDPKIRNLMKHIRVEKNQKIDEIFVEIKAAGKNYSAAAKGLPSTKAPPLIIEPPLTDDEIKVKFRNNASYGPLSTDKVENIINAVYRLEEIEDVSEMLRMLG